MGFAIGDGPPLLKKKIKKNSIVTMTWEWDLNSIFLIKEKREWMMLLSYNVLVYNPIYIFFSKFYFHIKFDESKFWYILDSLRK